MKKENLYLKKIIAFCVMFFFFIFNISAYEIANEKNSNFNFYDIVWGFYNKHTSYENSTTWHYAKFDTHIEMDGKDHNYYWNVYVDQKGNLTNLVLWVDNGYIRITYYPKNTRFTDGTSTWDLKNYSDYWEFRYTMVKTLVNFFSSCQLEKKKYGKNFSEEEIAAMTYLMILFNGD